MKPVEFSPAARADLIAIGGYIAADSADQAQRFVSALERTAQTVGERPRSFPARDDIAPGLRGAVHGRYLLLFRDLPDRVRIVRVIHGARDVAALSRRGELE